MALQFHTLLLYFLLFANVVLSSGGLIARNVESGDLVQPERRLRAARRSHELGARDVEGCLKYDHNLHYLDGKYASSHHLSWLTSAMEADTHGSSSQFAAKLGMQFKFPALMLEDIEHHIESVGCYSTEIHVYFSTVELLMRAHNEFASVDSFLLITSHQGCNEDGERSPHL